jgi:hypothetical protein
LAVDQTSATTPVAASAPPPEDSRPTDAASPPTSPGFSSRGRARRRARFLRKARELAYRDLGGLVFNLHRFGARNDALVLAKLGTIARIDAELRALERSLSERQPVTVLREAGITACPRCAAIHSGEDRFCPNCGLSMSRNVDLPIAGAPSRGAPVVQAPAPGPAAAPAPAAPAAAAAAPAPVAPAAAPAPAPAPAAPGPAQASPQTQTFEPVSPVVRGTPGGRSPSPPSAAPQTSAGGEQPTEIIRPPAAGS